MKKIALMTIFQVPNYGSVLQAYATQQVLSELGYECRIINYLYPNNWHYDRGWERPTFLSRTRHLLARLLNAGHGKICNSTEKFRKKYLNLTPIFADYNALAEYDWSNHILVTGSDQVWNPRFLSGDKAFMLGFAPENVKKVSMASSFACRDLPEKYIESYKNCLKQYVSLSVREQNGVNIINNQLGIKKEVRIMNDPTLLLPFDKWEALIPKRKISESPYVLLYELNYAFDTQDYIFSLAEEIKKRFNCKQIITLGGTRNLKDIENKKGCSVEDFLRLFRDAAVVVTNSFHGTAFAINAGRPLLSIIPENGDDRQLTLLSSLGLDQCAVKIGTPVQNTNPVYNVAESQKLLCEARSADIEWLREKLRG